MNIRSPKHRTEILKETYEIVKRIEGIFERITMIVKDRDGTVTENINDERTEISNRIARTLEKYGRTSSEINEVGRIVKEAIRQPEILQEADEYLIMLVEGFSAKAEGLLNYALNRETPKLGVGERHIVMMLSASNIMSLKGAIRKLGITHKTGGIYIEIGRVKPPKGFFEANGLHFDEYTEKAEILSKKDWAQPRVQTIERLENGERILRITITNEEELKTILDGKFFDKLLRFKKQTRIMAGVIE